MKAPLDLGKRVAKLLGDAFAGQPDVWRPKDKPYPALSVFDPQSAGLTRVSGVYAVWHLGVRPRWLRVGGARDLVSAITDLKAHDEIAAFTPNGGVFIGWAPVPPADIPAVVASLAAQLIPALQAIPFAHEVAPAETVTITFPLPPGTRSEAPPLA